MSFTARLDDLRPNRQRSAAFDRRVGSIVAHDVSEVVGALREVERAVREGLWAIGYVGYEAAPAFDSNLVVQAKGEFHAELPLVWFGLYETRVLNPEREERVGSYGLDDWSLVDARSHFESDVADIRRHIRAGDTYQVNYTSRLRSQFAGDPVAFYHDLAAAQSAGYGTYLDTGRFKIVSASPELFFDRYPDGPDTDRLITRPMKGTAARGRWPAEDLMQRSALVGSAKDRAENLIVVDLLRNDLGRVARFGTVEVDALFAVERFDTVWQLTSTISGQIDAAMPLDEVFVGLFPCGSITGAPKVRTMEIIADLESGPRGIYTGAIGFVSPPDTPGPRASFSVGIRTVVIDSETGQAEYGVGGGVTFDSDPAGEYEEAMLKAQILSYGSTAFELLETMRWNSVSGWYWLDRHLDRLEASADYFGIDVNRDQVAGRLEEAVTGSGEARIRLTVSRHGEVRITNVPFTVPERDSVAIAIDHQPVDVSSPFLFHKTTRRSIYEERQQRHPHADDVLLMNGEEEITESTIANVAVKLEGRWYTPPVEAGCLPGVYRGVLLDDGRIQERRIRLADLEQCEGLALLNSVRLWRPAFIIDD